jgi:hypothetical protein
MIKLLDIIKEGAITLNTDERQQVEDIIQKIIEIIKNRDIPDSGNIWPAGEISYIYSDGEKGKVKIGVGPIEGNAKGQFFTYDKNNRTDNWIFINQVYFSQFFPSSNSFQDLDQRLSRTVTGNENTGIERLRQTLKHELIHAKDPAVNHQYLKEPYSSEDEAIYYGSWAEFQTMTSQFFESLITGTDRVLNNADNPEDIKRIEKALSNILQYFAGKTKTINLDTKEFIDGTGSRNFFQKIFNFLNQIVRMPKDSDYALSEYLTYLSKIRQYNPEGYKEFLKDLYKTIKSIEEKVNSVSNTKIKVQEMKTQINEIKRMQQLAGIILENENVSDPEIEKAMAAGLSSLKDTSSLDEIEDENQPTNLNESVIAVIGSGLLAAPKIIEWIGKAIGFVSKAFSKEKDESTLAKKIQHFAHRWEKLYIKSIMFVVKKTKFVKQIWMTSDGKIDEQKLLVVSKYIYAALLAIAAGQAIGSVLGSSSAIIKAIEGSLGGIKAVEIAQIVSKVKGQL